MLVELSVMEQRYHAVMEVVSGAPVRDQLVPARKRKRRREDYKRWRRQEPMQLWQLDAAGSVLLADGTELKLISGLDDCSRFCVIAKVVRRATGRAVCRAFVAA